MRLFGSEARGEAGPDSDLDVLASSSPTRARYIEDRVIDIPFDVNFEFGLYISSPRVVTRGILNDPVWRETQFLKNAVLESIPL
jgi:predicted nucleotidyltransferase